MPVLNLYALDQVGDRQGDPVAASRGSALELLGPRVSITMFPFEAQLKIFADKGENLPAPITGWGLIDTGANVTLVDREVAERAGLGLVDNGLMSSATHDNERVPIFAGRLKLEGLPPYINAPRAYGAKLKSLGLIALIGRDVLADCVFIYNGLDGSYSLSV